MSDPFDRPSKLHERIYGRDKDSPIEVGRDFEGIADEKPRREGHQIRTTRAEHHPDMFRWVDPSAMASWSSDVPSHVRNAFREVIGDDPKVKILIHPFFCRYVVMQEIKDFEGHTKWERVCMFYDSPRPGYLPKDLETTDNRHEHLRGRIGDLIEPTKPMFEMLSKADRKKHKDEEILEFFEKPQEEEYEKSSSQLEQASQDAIEYGFGATRDAANQAEGSGQHMSSAHTMAKSVNEPEDQERFGTHRIVMWNGQRTRFRRGSRFEEAYEKEMADKAVKEAAAEAEVQRQIAEETKAAKDDTDLARRLTLHKAKQILTHRGTAPKKTL